MKSSKATLTWNASVKQALETLGGSAHLTDLNVKVREIREKAGVGVNPTFHATIRRTLQDGVEFFPDEKSPGTWHLKGLSASRPSDKS